MVSKPELENELISLYKIKNHYLIVLIQNLLTRSFQQLHKKKINSICSLQIRGFKSLLSLIFVHLSEALFDNSQQQQQK